MKVPTRWRHTDANALVRPRLPLAKRINMWNPFRKKKKNNEAAQSRPNAQQTNRVDELANTLQREGRINELERKLKELDCSSLSRPEQESWWHLYGIVAFQEGRETEALDRFKEAYSD